MKEDDGGLCLRSVGTYTSAKVEKKDKMERATMSPPPPQPSLPCGEPPAWSWGGTCKCSPSVRLPLQRLQNCALPLAHTPLTCAGKLEGLSLVSRSHTCLRVCASNGCTPAPQPFLEAHSGSPSLLPSVLLSPLPSSSTPLCCFPCPLFLLPSLFQPQLFLPALSCVLRLWLVCELRAC